MNDKGICRRHCSFNWLVFLVSEEKPRGWHVVVGVGRLGTKLSRLLNTRLSIERAEFGGENGIRSRPCSG